MSDTTSLFSLHNVLCPRFQLPSTQKKAFHRCTQLGKGVTAVHDGLRMIECVIFTMWTGGEANPDGPGTSQVFQNLQQFSPTLGKSTWLEDPLTAETLLRDSVQLLT